MTLLALGLCAPLGAQELQPELWSALTARSIGPAGMSGRITSIAVDPSDKNVVFVGAATGGLWKSVDRGTSWRPVFDGERVSGIGAVAVSPADPSVVWVGTGEGNPRNSAGVGAGVYRSTDGGESWTLVGLDASERIHRVVPHPTDPETAWVGAMGPAWSDGLERGVFKTTDGGRSWQHVLASGPRAGVSDLVLDPTDPDRLFAGIWEFRRSPWFFESGGPASGLYRSEDGGATWTRATTADGLPEGDLGRIGLSVHAADPRIVYALVEAETSALLRSDDGGRTWETVNDEDGVNPRPFYYTDVFVDPADPDIVYNLHSRAQRSTDGGRSFETISGGVHSDFHALWIDPDDPRHLWIGTDGGVFVSHDRGDHWRMLDNLPVGQFYHVSVDSAVPFNVYGGMQDNGSWRGPSDNWDDQGIRNAHWREVAFGDGFNTIVHPADPDLGFGMSQGGNLQRLDFRTGERKPIRPWGPDGTTLRFNWNAAIATDPYDRSAIYYGSQYVHRSADAGDSWQIISPDLTTNNPDWQRQDESGGLTRDATGAENFTSILTIAPSDQQQGVIWVGTDDGKVQITRAGGGTWQDLSNQIPSAVPPNTWVPHIEASKYRADAAYVVFDDHRRGNWEPLAFAVYDYGRDWRRMIDGDDVDGFVHTIEQDPVVETLFFAGTEFGLWVSVDRGENWHRWTSGVPTVPVRSLVVHPRDGDLVVGTHGRAIYVLDDIRPLRELALDPELPERAAHVFEPPPAYLTTGRGLDGYHFPAAHLFEGETRGPEAMISYWLDRGVEEAVVEIVDLDGARVRSLVVPGTRGLNRVRWDLREDLPAQYGLEDALGPRVLPGTYTVRLLADGVVAEHSVEVRPDPRVEIEFSDRIAKYQAAQEGALLRARDARARDAAERVRDAVNGVLAQMDESASADLRDRGREILDRLEALDDGGALRRSLRVVRGLDASFHAPTEGERIDLSRAREGVDGYVEALDGIIVFDLARFRSAAEAAGLVVFEEIRMIEGGR